MSWDALLFDFDGVLADTEPIHYECWREILAPFGIDLDWEFYQRNCVGLNDRLMVERLASASNPPVPFDLVWPEYGHKQEMFRAALLEQLPFRAGTIDLVRELYGFYKLAVVSSSDRSQVEPPLELAGIHSYFQAIICGKEVQHLKPAPDPYLRAAEMLGARCPLVIEDSDAGVASAKAAGFDLLRVSGPDRVADEVRARIYATSP
ncbi:MAG: HAD family hydrolase [Bryobacteraceae bacterium]